MVIWIIGLSGAGKSTVASELKQQINSLGKSCVMLDGDLVRELFGNDLSYNLQDRKQNADRLCKLGKYLDVQGVNVVCAILSIFPESREWNRSSLESYFEVFLDVELEDVISRDVKGIYARARSGEIADVVGVDIPFQKPDSSDLVIKNDFREDVSQIAGKILEQVRNRLY